MTATATSPSVAQTRDRDSWGGRALTLVGLSVIVSDVLFRVLDNAQQIYGDNDRRYIVASGFTSRQIGLLILAGAIGCTFMAVLNARRIDLRPPYTLWVTALVAWWLAASLIRGDVTDLNSTLSWLAPAVVAAAIVVDPPTVRTIRSFAWLLNLASVSALAYGLWRPEQQLPCREDKCGLFDSLFTGYFFQENAAARFIVLLLPAAAAIRSRTHLTITLLLAGVMIAATGSRTSQVSFAVCVLLVLWLRRKLLDDTQPAVHVPWPLRALPLAAFAASLWAFFAFDTTELTGRGFIYAAIRRALVDPEAYILGSGPDTVPNLILPNRLLVFGEHGQASHLLVYAGIPGLILFGLALASLLARRSWRPVELVALAFVVVAATQFVTEPVWQLDVRNVSFALLLLSSGLMAGVWKRGGRPEHAPPTPLGSVTLPTWGWLLLLVVLGAAGAWGILAAFP